MRHLLLVAAIASAAGGGGPAWDGHALRDQCAAAAQGDRENFCSGYLYATAETLQTVQRYYRRSVFNVCPPPLDAAFRSKLKTAFLDWASRNTDKLHHPANEVVIWALHDAFRCPRKEGRWE